MDDDGPVGYPIYLEDLENATRVDRFKYDSRGPVLHASGPRRPGADEQRAPADDEERLVRKERIRCPECGRSQWAEITWHPDDHWATYVHECIACGEIITESEWEPAR